MSQRVIRQSGDPRAEAAPARRLGPRDALDAVCLLVLIGVALYGLHSTYSGNGHLVCGTVAAALGVLLASALTALRAPVWLIGLLVPVAYFAFGGVLVLRNDAAFGVFPTPSVARDLVDVLLDGWKQLLTTLPPVAGSGRLLAIPYLFGLLAAAAGAALAQHSRSRFAPAVLPALVLAGAILLGTAHPVAQVAQGVAFGCIVVCWAALRRPAARPMRALLGAAGLQRLAVGLCVLGLAGAGAAWLGPRLPGHGSDRVVLRNYVRPPFDVAAHPSPLVGFRKYTKDAHQLYDQTLFTVHGLRAGTPVRLATLDDYDGSVWGATNGTVPTGPGEPIDAFQRVGSQIRTQATGRALSARIVIAAPYADARDVDSWVPTVGTLHSIAFHGHDAAAQQEAFRYNLATGSGVAADGLAAGDSYTIHAVLAQPTMPHDAAPYGKPTIDPDELAFVASRATQWSAHASGVIAQAKAVGRYMHQKGAYSDGGPGESIYLPGHSVGRLTSFLNAPQLVGDDEQYAAAYALICNYLGLPARVVLLAEPEANGTVQGKDVHATVEVHVRSDTRAEWVLLPRSAFMPNQDKTPDKRPPQTVQDANAAVVPPPNPIHPPSTLDEPDRPEHNTQHLSKPGKQHEDASSSWVGAAVRYAAIPLGAVALICLLVAATKSRRRAWRRGHGPIPARFDAGWRELVDWARDLGATVPRAATRYEQAQALEASPGGAPVLALAAGADAGVFGPGTPPTAAAAEFWRQVNAARHAMARGRGRLAGLRAVLNPRSLRRPTRPVRIR